MFREGNKNDASPPQFLWVECFPLALLIMFPPHIGFVFPMISSRGFPLPFSETQTQYFPFISAAAPVFFT